MTTIQIHYMFSDKPEHLQKYFPSCLFLKHDSLFALSSKTVFSQQQDYLKQFTLVVIKEKGIGSMEHEEGLQMLPLTDSLNQNT